MKKKIWMFSGILTASVLFLAGCGANASKLPGKSDEASKSNESAAGDAKGEKGVAAKPGSITYPLNSDKKISWYAQDAIIPHEKYKDASESPFHIGLAKNLGVDIEWKFPTTGSDAGTFTNTLLADLPSMPNIIEAYWMNKASQYLEDDIIWDLTDYIQEYAPDYYAWLKSSPDYDRAMKTDDGRYYTFGFFREGGGWNDSYLGPLVREDWLEECGLEVPKTISEFENVIRVFHEKYNATFDAAFIGKYKPEGVAGAFGAYGNAEAGIGWYIKDGVVGFAQAQPEWRENMSWQHKLWKEGLIDQDMMTEEDNTIKNKIHNDKCGISVTSIGQVTNWNLERKAAGKKEVWVGIPYPKSEDGMISSIFGGSGIGTQTAVISKTADEETMKVCLQMLNYSYTKEGSLYWNYGTEGVSWEYDSNGVPAFTSLVTDDKDTDPMTKYNGLTWGAPGIQATNFLYLKNSKAAIDANNTWYYVYPDDEEKNLAVTSGWKWPVGVTFTAQEADEMDEISQNLPAYVEESYAAFLTGSKDIDDDAVWNQYLADLETHHLSRVLEIRQACLDRYIAR